MSKMKLIMENWRKQVLEENKLNTVGELLRTITKFREASAGKAVGEKAVDMLLDQIPGLNNIWALVKGAKDTKELMSQLYGLGGEFKSNTGLDKIMIDPNISKIVDDNVEKAFLNYLIKYLKAMDAESEIPDVNSLLQSFLRDNFEQHTVTK